MDPIWYKKSDHHFFYNPETVEPYEFEVDFFGFKYCGNISDYIDWNVYFFGAYEKAELFLMRGLVMHNDVPVFLDVGANTGQHSLFMSAFCNSVHSFEPYEVVRAKLESKINVNGIKNIHIHKLGLGDKAEELEYYAPQGCNSGMGTFLDENGETHKELIGKLEVVIGDEYLKSNGIDNISLIKIDVEGFEKAVLLGLKETLQKHRPIILMELSGHTKASFEGKDGLLKVLPNGYKINQIIAERPIGVFFNRQSYELVDFDFDRSNGNILCVPVETI